jgi:hypothetical protein
MRRRRGNIGAMIRSFTAAPLTAADIAVAFPLVHAALPGIDLAMWRRFARGIVDLPSPYPAGGACLRNEGGYICGVLTYHIEGDLRHGTALTVDLFAALDVTGEEAATHALLQVAEEKARDLHCTGIRVTIARGGAKLARRFLTSGYRAEATIFCKPLDGEPICA